MPSTSRLWWGLGQSSDRAIKQVSVCRLRRRPRSRWPFNRYVAVSERVANRIVFGERATPYEVLADFSRRAAEAPDDEFLERIPRLIVDGTGADRAALWVHEGAGFNAVASWPDGATTEILGDEFHDPEADLSLPVFHDGELLGGVSLQAARGETITPPEAGLLDDLVAGLGIALRNARLTENLRHQVERARKVARPGGDGCRSSSTVP